ncbi:hypothetical protein Tco_0662962 [Tanacetum coccineum]
MSQDVIITVMNSLSVTNESANMEMQICEYCDKCLNLYAEFSKSKQAYNALLKNQFDSIKKTRVRTKEQSDSLIDQLNLKSAENEDLKAQIQDKVFVITSLKNNLRKLKGKEIVENVIHIPFVNTIAPGMFKLDLEPLPSRLLQNREVHRDYLRNTQEQANILREIVEQAKVKQPLDGKLDLPCKKVAVTPMNNIKKVGFAKPLTSSINSKQVESSNTSDSNTPVLSSTGVKCSTKNCRSKPSGNKKNYKISQTPRLIAFCFKTSLRFASRPHCVLLQDLIAFCFKLSLRFASTSLRFAQDLHCVLLEDHIAF